MATTSTPDLVLEFKKQCTQWEEVEPILPVELERHIFEMAFDPDNLGSNLNMTYVARRVYCWIKPLLSRILFQHACSSWGSPIPDFTKHWRTCKIQEIGPFVKHIFLHDENFEYTADPYYTRNSVASFVRDLLIHSPNVEDLACWRKDGLEEDVVAYLFRDSSKLRRLSLTIVNSESTVFPKLPRYIWDLPGFKALTRLELIDCPPHWSFEVLAPCVNLIHLCIAEPIAGWTDSTVRTVLSSCTSLKVLIIAIAFYFWQGAAEDIGDLVARSGDNRVVLMDSESVDQKDWLECAKGRFNAWVFAEWIVTARNNNYFKDGVKHWDAVAAIDFEWETSLTAEGLQWFSKLRR